MVTLFQVVSKRPLTTLLTLSAPLFMFAHIYYLYHPEINQGGIFGYKYWSVFFNSFMWPLFAFVVGYLINLLSRHYIEDPKGKTYAGFISIKAYCISLYYFIITIFPYDNSYARIGLDHSSYYIVAVVSALVSGLIIANTPKDITKKLKKIIAVLFKYIYEDLENKQLINPNKIDDFRKSRIEITEIVVEYEYA